MKDHQYFRFMKLFNEHFYLLNITSTNNNITFSISGSTNNIYNVKIMKNYTNNHIYCNCPDAKKWANIYGVVCKHILFIIYKVIKLFKINNNDITTLNEDSDTFLENKSLNKDQIEIISIIIEMIDMGDTNEFTKKEYIDRYESIKNNSAKGKGDNSIVPRENCDIHCSICYDDFGVDTITNKKIVSQCVVCKTIFHKTCLTKWFNYNKTCPFCRTPNNIKSSSGYYKNLFETI